MRTIGTKDETKEYEKRNAAYAFILNDKKECLVLNIDDFGYNLPGGKIDENEVGTDALQREMMEETGYALENIEFIETIQAYYDVSVRNNLYHTDATAHFYKADLGSFIKERQEKNHHVEFMSLIELKKKLYFDFQRAMIAEINKGIE